MSLYGIGSGWQLELNRLRCLKQLVNSEMRVPLLTYALMGMTVIPLASAAPLLQTFSFADTGIVGWSGAAGLRGSSGWDGPLYAAWDIRGKSGGTMIISNSERLQAFAYRQSQEVEEAATVKRRIDSGRVDMYSVDLVFTKKIGYEPSGGDRAGHYVFIPTNQAIHLAYP
jgi:hypothetical protein